MFEGACKACKRIVLLRDFLQTRESVVLTENVVASDRLAENYLVQKTSQNLDCHDRNTGRFLLYDSSLQRATTEEALHSRRRHRTDTLPFCS